MKNPRFESSTGHLMVAILFLSIVILAMAVPVRAAPRTVITVTNNNDSGAGSLRNAITNANTGETIVFSLTLPTTITLSSELEITTSLTISGPGTSLLTISGNNVTRVISVTFGTNLNLLNVTIANGSEVNGGGILNKGTLTITNSTISGNSAFNPNGSAAGGGIANSGTLTIINSTFSGNSASGFPFGHNAAGGGIANSGTLTIINATISGNSAWSGGGIVNSGMLAITNSTISDNGSDSDGGVLNNGTVTIANSTFSGNHASFESGGIANSGTLTITNSTFSGNWAGANFGGIANFSGTVTLRNTIVANSPNGGNCNGAITNGGNNIDDGTTCGWGSNNGSMSNTNPQLNPLANNGGPTLTMALLPGSPAIDGVTFNMPNGCPSTDQRGFQRPAGPRCDIGAYEYYSHILSLPLIMK